MSKAILEFSLPEEQDEFDAAVRGNALRGRVTEFDNWLRGIIKYTDWAEADADRQDIYQAVRDKLHELTSED